jgi:hypothetical protein
VSVLKIVEDGLLGENVSMRRLFIIGLLLCASCAPPPRPYSKPPSNGRYESRTAPDNRPAPPAADSRSTGNVNGGVTQQDAADCERKAALSASAGGRAEAFNNCMKARTSN